MSDRSPLTDDEIAALREIIPHLVEMKAEAQYRAARALLVTSWRQSILVLAALVSATLLLWERLKEVFQWIVR